MVKIPIVPRWSLTNGCVSTPDGGLLYIGGRSINYICCAEKEAEYPDVKIFHTRQAISSIDIDPHWGEAFDDGKETTSLKLFAVLSQDNSVQVWDFNKGCAWHGHKAHLACNRFMEGNGPFPQHTGEVFISFMNNRNILSIDNQDIVVYCVASNSFYRRPMFLSPRHHQLSAMKCSPYNFNHFAVGTSRGLVLLCDLQKMVTLYTLRGHDTSITALAWNRFEPCLKNSQDKGVIQAKKDKEPAKTQKLVRTDTKIVDNEDIFDIYDYDYLDNEFGAASQDAKPNTDSDFVGIEKPNESSGAAQFDFAEACQSLKEEINALREDQKTELSPEHVVSLEDCKNADTRDNTSVCNSETKEGEAHSDVPSSDGSLVRLVCGTPSSEDSMEVDGRHHVICKAEVHAALAMETKAADSLIPQTSHKTGHETSEKQCEIEKAEPQWVVLLASISTDGGISIWNTCTGAACDKHKIRSSTQHKNSKMHIIWYTDRSFITCNKSGEVQIWTMQKESETTGRFKFKEDKREWQQSRVVDISFCEKRQLFWCVTSNRELLLEDMTQNKIILNYGCVSTNITVLSECPDNMNKIALGLSDRRIGILDISKLTPKLIQIENYVQRIESPVSALDWSPDCKRIAYGTIEGRIGIINVEGSALRQQQSLSFNSACGKTIHSIKWLNNHLYVVCNEFIAVYNGDGKQKDGIVLPGINKVSTITIRENYLFVGNSRGIIQVYEQKKDGKSFYDYHLKFELEVSSRYISDISWSPIAKNILAIASDSNRIHIIEFMPDTRSLAIKRTLEITSAKAGTACVKWSNRNENLILSCGSDGAIRVWNLSEESDNERFIKRYHCPMKCGLFLPTDEEVVLCAGKSTSLEFVDMRIEKSDDHESKTKLIKTGTLDNVQWATKATSYDDNKKQNRRSNKNNESQLKSTEKISNLKANSLQNLVEEVGEIEEDVTHLLSNLNIQKSVKSPDSASIYMKNPQTLLYLTTKELNKDALDLMYNILTDQLIHSASEKKPLCAKLFGSKSEATQLLAEELKNHQNSENKGISSIFMTQLNTNLKEEILKCVQAKQLCEWHVSLAPTVSFSFWQKCCQAYAEQLAEKGFALQSAVYYLAIHKQRDAINVLMQMTNFTEAMLIARIYLQMDDPLFATITEGWITHLYKNGNLTGAALLCCLNKQNDRAYEYLVKIRKSQPEIERILRLLKKNSINLP